MYLLIGLGSSTLPCTSSYLIQRYLPPLVPMRCTLHQTGQVSSGRDLLMLLLHHPLRFGRSAVSTAWHTLRNSFVAACVLPLLESVFPSARFLSLGINFRRRFRACAALNRTTPPRWCHSFVCGDLWTVPPASSGFFARVIPKTTLAVGLVLALLLFRIYGMAHRCSHDGEPATAPICLSKPAMMQVRAALAPFRSIRIGGCAPGPLAHLAARPRVISPPEYDDGKPVDVILTPDAAPREARIGGQRIIE